MAERDSAHDGERWPNQPGGRDRGSGGDPCEAQGDLDGGLTGIRSGYFDLMRSASDFLRSIGCSLLKDMMPELDRRR